MPRQQLSLDTLAEFDYGKAAVAFQTALERVVRDCLDRPGEKKPRTVTLVAKITPVLQQSGDVVDCEVAFEIAAAIPKWLTAPQAVGTTKQGHLFFQELAPDSPKQMTVADFTDADEAGDGDE